MEELRSAEILDKEIQDDARKKAEKILRNADSQCDQIMAQVESRLEEAKKEKEIYFNQKAEQVKKDLDSSMPLEKSRFLVSYISSSIAKGINEYLKTLSSEKRFELAVSLLNQFSNLVSDRTFDAAVYGFDPAYVKSTLSSKVKINSCSSVEFAKSGSEAVDGIEIHEGVILLSEDKSVKIRLTLEEVITELIDKYRKELAVTLFGGRLPE
ncbi:MAG: V-type ATP synthase subunit E [Treponema sp.]|uniref:V-type ATP synthase subunit E n=1 Tax=Treponema sp. TaxID=166 RepID=UPI00298DCD36|nr:V-type ATP synthase subunit E [Treponema sp.]MDD5812155.1 V-type ATP synthase subunit E [Treponema sp.]